MPCVAWSQESLRTGKQLAWGSQQYSVPCKLDPFRVWLDTLHNLETLYE